MSGIVKIDGELFTTDDFIKLLKLNGRFESLMEEMLKDQLTVRAAKKQGINVSDEDIQERADQFRRIHGLHRTRDTIDFLDALSVTTEDFERFITDMLYQEKIMSQVCSESAIEECFQLNSPRFESIEISHIVMDSEGAAREMLSVLGEDPDNFAQMASEHSVADTRGNGGRIGKVMRGALQGDIEAKVFSAQDGDLLGPYPTGDGEHFEIFRVDHKHATQLDDETSSEIKRLLRENWMTSRAKEHRIEPV
jgi:parvulin-like peptidyl-prolyl isomerase